MTTKCQAQGHGGYLVNIFQFHASQPTKQPDSLLASPFNVGMQGKQAVYRPRGWRDERGKEKEEVGVKRWRKREGGHWNTSTD